MPGYLIQQSAMINCAHMGQAKPTTVNQRVTVGGEPTVLQSTPYTVSGCGLPPNAGGPCVTGQWVTGTTRVLSMGQPLLIQSSQAICTPTGTPLTVISTQTRVTAT